MGSGAMAYTALYVEHLLKERHKDSSELQKSQRRGRYL